MEGIHSDGGAYDDNVHAFCVTEVDPIHEPETALHDSLVMQVDNLKIGNSTEFPNNVGGDSLEDENTGFGDCNLDLEGPIAMSSKLQKCSTFPIAVKEETTIESEPESKSCKRSQSLPTDHKLVSALKGNREKEGIAPRKLSVSWAPDVYDPVPTPLFHCPKKKTQQVFKYGKKHVKGKQKSKNVRGAGSGSKDKKHHRKMGGRSDRFPDSIVESDRVISSSNSYTSLDVLDFDNDININIGCPDPKCSSNYLEKAGGTMHCVC